jgi:hypothetical protein
MRNNILNFLTLRFVFLIFTFPFFFSVKAFGEIEIYEEPVLRIFDEYQNSLIDEATFSARLYQLLIDNPDYLVDRTIRDALLESEISNFFADFLLNKELANLESRGTLLESPSVIPVATKIFPPVSPLIFKIRKINETHQKLETCSEVSNKYECISSVFQETSELPYLASLFLVKIKDYNKELIPSFEEELFYALMYHSLLLSNGEDFCNSYFDPKEYSSIMFDTLSDQGTIEKIAGFIEKVPTCYVPILTTLRSRTIFAIDVANVLEAENGIRYLEVLENSHEELYEIKKRLILSSSSEFRNLAKRKITGDIFNSLEFKEKLRIIVTGRLQNIFYVLVLVSTIFLLGFFFLAMRVYNSIETTDKENSGILSDKNKIKKSKKLKKSNSSFNLEESNIMDEYTALLLIFGLSDDATDSDIKKAFRDAIKRLHPDSGLPVDPDKLEEVQKAHDRLMELRGGWFGATK